MTQQLGLHGLNHQSDAAWCASWLVLRATRASSRRRQCTARAPRPPAGAAGEAQPPLPVLLSRRHQGDALHGGTFRNVCYDRDHPTPSAGTY